MRSQNLMMKTLGAMAMAVFAAACSPQKFGLQEESQTFGQKVEYSTEVDVLLVIDTSTSMTEHQQKLSDQMPGFVSALNKTGLSYRIAVTTMDVGNGGARGRFISGPGSVPAVLTNLTPNLVSVLQQRLVLGEAGSTVERGLEAMRLALTPPNTQYENAGFLRDGSLLVVIFLSDEEDKSANQDYVGFLNALRPPLKSGERSWVANFMGVLPNDPFCNTARWNLSSPGTRYAALAQSSNGRSESICSGDLRLAVDKIKARIIEIVTEYSLGDRKANKSTIRVYINGKILAESAENGWTYNEDRNSITFHGTGVPAPGSTIHVDFTPEGIK